MRITLVGNVNCGHSSESHHAKSLEALGHTVARLQEGKATGAEILEEGLQSDMLVYVHTHGWQTPGLAAEKVLGRLNTVGIPTVTYHLDLWLGLERQRDLERDPFYRSIGWFFTVDKLMADWFRQKTAVKGVYLPAGVFKDECYLAEPTSPHGNDAIFVGSRGYHKAWGYRPQLIDWLKSTYGPRFTHIGGDGQVPTTRGDALNRLYASSKVSVGDTLCLGFDYPFYLSDRIFEACGRGSMIIHPYIKGMEDLFDLGKHVITYKYGDFDDLRSKIDFYVEHDDEREAIRLAGHEHVKANHNYEVRWQTILDTVFG